MAFKPRGILGTNRRSSNNGKKSGKGAARFQRLAYTIQREHSSRASPTSSSAEKHLSRRRRRFDSVLGGAACQCCHQATNSTAPQCSSWYHFTCRASSDLSSHTGGARSFRCECRQWRASFLATQNDDQRGTHGVPQYARNSGSCSGALKMKW
jgi:hypothetical protein